MNKKCKECGNEHDNEVCLPCETIREALESFPMEECRDVIHFDVSDIYQPE